jgi:predicted acyl esterase
MIPMRDGVKLYTVIIVPKGAKDAPILLTRTPYDAKKQTKRKLSPHVEAITAMMDEPFVSDGYIRVYQDIRGKHNSRATYVATRPLIGPLNQTKGGSFHRRMGHDRVAGEEHPGIERARRA